jgi:hypothetical protein
MPRLIAIGTIPLLFIAVLLILNFYKRFFQYLKNIENNMQFSSLKKRLKIVHALQGGVYEAHSHVLSYELSAKGIPPS